MALPVRVALPARSMTATLEASRVTFRRAGDGRPPLYVTVPVSCYQGVVMTRSGEALQLVLRHRNGDLDLPLLEAEDDDDIIADWQAWARILDCPALIEGADGALVDPFPKLGELKVDRPRARRANTFFRERRPKKLMYREVGGEAGPVHRDEREIIART
ncbi:MAG: hypothetical protein H6883_01820 [Rhodobiaceae bacterium]|nr:hypothetical protein [Rhodobiaceae bacterium]MCC0054856.1 hypothetical protein [Rhodobiaceae bacterium]